MAERTLVLVKPDGVQRGLVGEVITRLERRGLKLAAMKLMQVSDGLARQHYGEHVDRPFFSGLVSFITSSPIVAMVWEANNAAGNRAQYLGTDQPGQLGGPVPSGATWVSTSAATWCMALTVLSLRNGKWTCSSGPRRFSATNAPWIRG